MTITIKTTTKTATTRTTTTPGISEGSTVQVSGFSSPPRHEEGVCSSPLCSVTSSCMARPTSCCLLRAFDSASRPRSCSGMCVCACVVCTCVHPGACMHTRCVSAYMQVHVCACMRGVCVRTCKCVCVCMCGIHCMFVCIVHVQKCVCWHAHSIYDTWALTKT